MSASCPGSMRGPRVKTPLLLLLLLLLSTLTGTVLCQHEGNGTDPARETKEEEAGDDDTETTEPLPTDSDASSAPGPSPTEVEGEETVAGEHGSGQGRIFRVDASADYSETTVDPNFTGSTSTPDKEEEEEDDGEAKEKKGLSPIVILIPVVLVVLIISVIVCSIFITRQWSKKARNQELQKEDPYLDGSSTEKVPMPMFEEDVPSVLELEMEELDQWMKNDGETAEDAKHA